METELEARPFLGEKDRERVLARLARVEGQLRGIQRLIREDQDCEKVVQQLAAARGGLHGAFCELIACAFETKLRDADGEVALHDSVERLTALLKKYA